MRLRGLAILLRAGGLGILEDDTLLRFFALAALMFFADVFLGVFFGFFFFFSHISYLVSISRLR